MSFGVDPSLQRRGIGQALLQIGEKKVRFEILRTSFFLYRTFSGRGAGLERNSRNWFYEECKRLYVYITLVYNFLTATPQVNMYRHLGYTLAGFDYIEGAEGTGIGMNFYVLVKAPSSSSWHLRTWVDIILFLFIQTYFIL